ncbi:23S rRNA (uracil(1939)-C(5))-methyltransferase RlmD [Scopulibacillus daqui]|uniref:23S rRNA (uracil(1939)-C(5))-methyltransferase RlmD n=1 Tax=Scopulibacillus daqui TaxID=1469162 RepID=UPI0036408053
MVRPVATPVKKNDIIEVSFHDLTHDGSGVGKIDGYALFVSNVLPGEKAKIKVLKTKKGYGYGKLLELQKSSPDRVDPPCDIYDQCGGCQLQHLSYEGQLNYKRNQVKEVLERIGGLKDISVKPVLGMDEPWRYRNKVQVPVGEKDGEFIAGFYQKRSHKIVDMDHCLIQDSLNDEVVQKVKQIAKECGIEPYNEETHRGILRHIVTRIGQNTGEIMVVLVTKTEELPFRKRFIKEIPEAFPEVKSIAQNINPNRTNTIFGEKTKTLWGREEIYDTIGDIKFAISARSFYQVNPVQTHVLYNQALEYAGLTGNETVIDAYCGIGTISLFLAKKAKHVYGVEIVPQAIEDAKANAELNHLNNVAFEAGKAEEVIPNWYKQGVSADVLVVDPPRKGCDEALLNTMIDMKPERIVYVSCNPSTLARDLKILEAGGFETVEVQPVDMFPQTTHVECVALLKLK